MHDVDGLQYRKETLLSFCEVGRWEPAKVTTILTPLEQVRVDVAARGTYSTIHRNSVNEVMADLRSHRASAVLISVARYDVSAASRISVILRHFPEVPTFALLTDIQRATPQLAHALGQLGVRTMVDVRHPAGWSRLRDLIGNQLGNDIQHVALTQLSSDLRGIPRDGWRFFELLFTYRPYLASVRQLGRLMNVRPATLLSRFFRADLPSPKQYIDMARLVRAARLLESVGLSLSAVANQLDYSSPQAFGRHIRCVFDMSAIEFRQTYNSKTMLQHFRESLILPYREVLRGFHPVDVEPMWIQRC